MWHDTAMHRTLIAVVTVGGCTLHEPKLGDDQGNPPPARMCPTDPDLRLCVQFDGSLTPTVGDQMNHTIDASAVTAMTRDTEPAAHVGSTSTLYIQPSDAGNLDVAQLTIEMWISPDTRPMPMKGNWMLDNNTEYGIEYRDDGQVRCVIHDKTVDSMTQ